MSPKYLIILNFKKAAANKSIEEKTTHPEWIAECQLMMPGLSKIIDRKASMATKAEKITA